MYITLLNWFTGVNLAGILICHLLRDYKHNPEQIHIVPFQETCQHTKEN